MSKIKGFEIDYNPNTQIMCDKRTINKIIVENDYYKKKTADLEQQLSLTEKALELACLVISKAMCPNGDWESLKIDFVNSYKEQAKEMMKSE